MLTPLVAEPFPRDFRCLDAFEVQLLWRALLYWRVRSSNADGQVSVLRW